MLECLLPTFGVLTNSQIQKINENSYVVKYKEGETICSQNHPVSHVMHVKSGLVKLFREYDPGKTSIIGIVGTDRYLCLMSVFYDKLFQNAASALEDSEIVHTSLSIFLDIVNKNGRYAYYLLKQISIYGHLIIDKMIKNTYKQIPGRVAEVLLYFSKEIYKSDTYTLPLSRQEFADFVSATKETVSRTLTEFKNDRLIEVNDRIITLKSLDLIDKLSKIG